MRSIPALGRGEDFVGTGDGGVGIGRGIFIFLRRGAGSLPALGRAAALPRPVARSASDVRAVSFSPSCLVQDVAVPFPVLHMHLLLDD